MSLPCPGAPPATAVGVGVLGWGTFVLASHSCMALAPTTMASGCGGPPRISSSGRALCPAGHRARCSSGRAVRPQAHLGLPHATAGLGLRPVIKPSGLTDTADFGDPVQAEHTRTWRFTLLGLSRDLVLCHTKPKHFLKCCVLVSGPTCSVPKCTGLHFPCTQGYRLHDTILPGCPGLFPSQFCILPPISVFADCTRRGLFSSSRHGFALKSM